MISEDMISVSQQIEESTDTEKGMPDLLNSVDISCFLLCSCNNFAIFYH